MGRDNQREIGSGEVGRFDQRNTMFSRPRDRERSSPEIQAMGKKHYGVRKFKNDEDHFKWATIKEGLELCRI